MLQESVRHCNIADKQNEKIDALEWRTSLNSEESTWPNLDKHTIAILVVPKEKVEIVQSTTRPTVSKISCKSKFIKKAQQAKKRNMKKSNVVVELSTIQETASEIISVSEPNVPGIDKCKQAENTSFKQMHKNK